jgi:ATPase subunit of ABC transporter with duplicated ATPase domains
LTRSYLKAQSPTRHYGDETLVSGVDLVLSPGDRVGPVGPTGVGKTTLLALLGGYSSVQDRLALARLLLTEPDVLMLGEPTNHLDSSGTAWLGEYLARFAGAVLVVSHDRSFLDRAVMRIVELDGIHEAQQWYQGGYTAYRQEKARRWQRLLLDYAAQEKYRRRLERQIQSVRWIAEPQTRPPLVLALPQAGGRERRERLGRERLGRERRELRDRKRRELRDRRDRQRRGRWPGHHRLRAQCAIRGPARARRR